MAFFGVGVILALGILFPMGWPSTAKGVWYLLPNAIAALGLGGACAFFLGQWTARASADEAVRALRGVVTAWLTLVVAALAGSFATVVQGESDGGLGQWIADYLFKPLFWVLLVGTLPALILGGIYGSVIGRYARDR